MKHRALSIVYPLGVTGVRKEIKTDIQSIVDTIRKYTDKPVAVGFVSQHHSKHMIWLKLLMVLL